MIMLLFVFKVPLLSVSLYIFSSTNPMTLRSSPPLDQPGHPRWEWAEQSAAGPVVAVVVASMVYAAVVVVAVASLDSL